jgi:hypothetical protein
MKYSQRFALATLAFLLQGCATVFEGYYDRVELVNPPDSLRVCTSQGVEIPVERSTIRVRTAPDSNTWESRPATFIELRSNLDPVLILRSGDQERRVQAFGKIKAAWFFLDMLFVVPLVVDGVTGNWNSYEPIEASFE